MNFDQLAFYRLLESSQIQAIPRQLTSYQLAVRERLSKAIKDGHIQFEHIDQCLCGGKELTQISAKEGFGFDIGAFLCRSCGLLITSPALTADSLPLYYKKFHHDLWYGEAQSKNRGVVGRGHKIYNMVMPFLPQKSKMSVLDVGGGNGSVLQEFIQASAAVGIPAYGTLLDYSPDILDIFKNDDLIKPIIGDLQILNSTQSKFDVIILSHVVEHFKNPLSELKRLIPHLKDKAIVYVEVPGIFSIQPLNPAANDLLPWIVFCHLYHFNLISLANLMSHAGFKLVYGNEQVESIFRFDAKHPETFDASKNAIEVLSVLKDLERNVPFYRELRKKTEDLDQCLKKIRRLEKMVEQNQKALLQIRNFPLVKAVLWAIEFFKTFSRK